MSFDVVSLFTKVPVEKGTDTAREKDYSILELLLQFSFTTSILEEMIHG